jgi:uncharacterized protein YjbI with pentapeptide repeats
VLEHADLSQCDLRQARLHRVSKDGADFSGTDLSYVDETDARRAAAEDFRAEP